MFAVAERGRYRQSRSQRNCREATGSMLLVWVIIEQDRRVLLVCLCVSLDVSPAILEMNRDREESGRAAMPMRSIFPPSTLHPQRNHV